MSCESYRELLPAYLDDSLDEVRRTALRAHLSTCDECRAAAIRREPTLALSLAGGPEPPEERVEACVTAVMAGVRRERLERQLKPARRPWLAAAAAVVVAVIASAVWWVTSGGPAEEPILAVNAATAEASAPAVVEETPQSVEPPPRVEVEPTQDDVRVYQYAIGDDDSTGAVFIVNPSLEL